MSKAALIWNPVSPFEGREQRGCNLTRMSARVRSPGEMMIHHVHQGKIAKEAEYNEKNCSTEVAAIVKSVHAGEKTSADTDFPVFCISPRECLMVSKSVHSLQEKVSRLNDVSDFPYYTTDLSDRYAVIKLSGPGVASALARGTAVDLEGLCRDVGSYVQTRLFNRAVIIHRVSMVGDFDIYVDRSLSVQLMIWLFDAP